MKRQNSKRKDQFQHILEQREIIEAEQDWNIYVTQQRLKHQKNANQAQKQREQELTMKVMIRKARDREEALTNNNKTLKKKIEKQKHTLKITQRHCQKMMPV